MPDPLKDNGRAASSTAAGDVAPFLVAMLGALAMVTFWPDLVLFVPRLAGYTG